MFLRVEMVLRVRLVLLDKRVIEDRMEFLAYLEDLD